MAKKPLCKNCKHWVKLPKNIIIYRHRNNGICHRFPVHAKTNENDSCGEFEEKK